MRRAIERAAVVGVLFFIAGCSEPPNKERDQAVSAIAAAQTAGAVTYATDELAAAQASLTRFDGLVAQHEYKQALSAALDARDRAFEAAKAAAAAQTALRAQADQLLNAMAAAIAVADADLKTAASAGAARRADRLRQTRKASVTAMQDARTLLSAGELTKAVKRLVDANAALKRDIAALEPQLKKPSK